MSSTHDRNESAAANRAVGQELSALDLLNVLLVNRRLVVLLPLILVVAVGIYSLTRPHQWESTAVFVPEMRSNAGLAGMAAQFGFALPTGETGESPVFYSELIRSRSVLGATVDSAYSLTVDGQELRVVLADYLEPDADAHERRNAAINHLEQSIEVETSRETGLVRMTVSTRHPELSRQIAAMLLDLVHEFNIGRRQNQAGAERRFVEDRLAHARDQLAHAEDELQRFQETNRQIRSPGLVLEVGRLQHDLLLRQQIVSSLAESYERARIDEVRNIPLITVIEEPETPVRPEGRGTVVRVLLAFLVGLVLAAIIAGARASMSAATGTRSDVRLFRRLRREAIADLTRPFSGLRSSSRHTDQEERDG